MGVNREDIINGLASGISAVYLPTGKMNLCMEGGQGELQKIGMMFINIEEKIGMMFADIEEIVEE